MLEPRNSGNNAELDALIMEFKVQDEEEKELSDTEVWVCFLREESPYWRMSVL